MTSVLGRQPWWRTGTPDQRRRVADAAREARRKALDRRSRVRAHPDLAQRLVAELDYERFDQWNGYVPPARLYADKDRLNTCRERRSLVAILKTVVEREQAPA